MVRTIRIVVASPGDVKAERDTVDQVVAELNRGIAAVFESRLEVIRWETDALPGFHSQGPQGLIDASLRIEACDLLVGIFWKRFGTPTEDSESGTAHEFKLAYDSWKKNGTPQIMMYFKQKPYMPRSKTETDQQGRVLEFRENFPDEGLWWQYKERLQFERAIRNHLTQFVLHRSTLERESAKTGAVQPETFLERDSGTDHRLPGGPLARRPLHLIWMIDCSGSMAGDRINALNHSMRELIPQLRSAARENPHAEMLIRVLTFSSGARWHIDVPTSIEQLQWTDLTAAGATDVGAGLRMVAKQLSIPPMSLQALPPVIVLMLDGEPTDDFAEGLRILNEQVWGRKSVRLGIAIGRDADRDVLQQFIGAEREPIEINNAVRLLEYIRWSITSLSGSAPPTIQGEGEEKVTMSDARLKPLIEHGDEEVW